MPSPTTRTDVQAEARAFRRRLLREEAAARREMATAYREVRRALVTDADALLRRIEVEGVTSANQLYRLRRYSEFIADTEARLTAYAAGAHQRTVALAQFAADLSTETAAALVTGQVAAIGVAVSLPDAAAVAAAVSRVSAGRAAELFASVPADAARKVATAIVTGVARGLHPSQVAREIRAAADTTAYAAQRIARTECVTAYRTASLDSYRSSRVVQAWQWLAELDEATCAICWAMAGTIHEMTEDFDTHPQCRCVPVPMTMSEAEAAAQGWDMTTGEERFAALDREEQLAVLGPGRLAAYEGGVPLSSMNRRIYDENWGWGRALVPVRDLDT